MQQEKLYREAPEATLKELAGKDAFVTPDALARTLAYVIEQLKASPEGAHSEPRELQQQYATPAQLSRLLGADKVTLWRTLRQLEESKRVDVIRLAQGKSKEAHPRYKIADVIGALRENAMRKQEA